MNALALILALQAAAPQEPKEAPRPPIDEAAIIRQLANPLSALFTLNLLSSFDHHIGIEREGYRFTELVQPTIPLSLGENWNVLSRVTIPLVYQEDVVPADPKQSGLGDLVSIIYLSKVDPSPRGYLGALGPIVRMPTGEDYLGLEQWQVGPSFAAVKPQDAFTFGILSSHLWSVETRHRPKSSVTFVEPFVEFMTDDLWTVAIHVPTEFDWWRDQWTVPLVVSFRKLVTFQHAPVQISFGIRYNLEVPDNAPHGFGFQFGLRLVQPR